MTNIVHCISPWVKGGGLAERQALFLESVDRAWRPNVKLIASADSWEQLGWTTYPRRRNATEIGDPIEKPFLRDLLDQASELANPHDWLLCGNVDCSLAPDFYENLTSRRGTAVEYQRQDIHGHPQTLDELYSFPRTLYDIGMDAYALRASFYRELRPYFPDFILGEPLWDTALSGLLRHHLPIERDTARLFHPQHEQAWSLGKLSPAGQHNNRIYVEILTYGFSSEHVIREANDQTDTAVVWSVFGADPLRVAANTEGIRRQLTQDLLADFYLVELLEGVESLYPADLLAQVNHIPVPCTPANAGLFQKEAMFNVGWRAALSRHRYDYFAFVDADVYSEQPDWLRQVRARLRDNPARAVQGFQMVTDTQDPQCQCSSLASSFHQSRPTDLRLNPGICWGLHREMLLAADGFNPISMASCGDSLFVSEFLNAPAISYDPWLYQFGFFRSLYRDLPFRAEFDYVPVDLRHCYHGPVAERNYDGGRYAVDGLGDLAQWIEVDGAGLVAWKDPAGAESQLLRRQPGMSSREAVDAMFTAQGLCRVAAEGNSRPFVPRDKPLFRIPNWTRPATLGPVPETESAGLSNQHLNLYHPRRIYRTCFPFSWCGNVRCDATNHIPSAVRDGVPRLLLEGLPDVPWVSAVLAMETNWQPLDLTPYRTLHFTLMVSGPNPYPQLGFVQLGPAGQEVDTPVVKLWKLGLQPDTRIGFHIPLTSFWPGGESRQNVRLLRWAGGGSFNMEISQVYIE